MIVCISPNPALDTRKYCTDLRLGETNRLHVVERRAGGKGAHVALAARALGAFAMLIGPFGGATGEHCQRALLAAGIPVLPVCVAAETRENLELFDAQGQSTELLEAGGPVSEEEQERLFECCRDALERIGRSAVVTLSGSVPQGASSLLFARLIASAKRGGATTIVDASGESLREALGAAPDYIKPNRDEARALLHADIDGPRAALAAAAQLRKRGAERVVLSLGSEGLVGVDAASAFLARCPEVRGRSAVGCGDATVAALAVAAERKLAFAETLRLAAAAGAANCRADTPGALSALELNRSYEQAELIAL